MLVLSNAAVGATRFTTLTAGVMIAVPVLAALFTPPFVPVFTLVVTAGVDTLAALALTLLLATVAATAVAAWACAALAANCATVFVVLVAVVVLLVPLDAGVLGA